MRSGSPKHSKKSGKFGKFLFVYSLILLILGTAVVLNVRRTMLEMRDNNVENFIGQSLEKLGDGELKELFDFNETYETEAESLGNIRKIFEAGEYTIKKSPGEGYVYNIYSGERKMLSVRLRVSEHRSRLLGMMRYDIYELEGFDGHFDGALISRTLSLPSSGYEAKINGRAAEGGITKPVRGFLDADKFVPPFGTTVYELENLSAEPEIEVFKDSLPVPVRKTEEGNFELAEDPCVRAADLAELGCDFDVIAFGEMWSRFLTADLAGGGKGFDTIKASFIKGSEMYEKARAWANGIDISFVSHHVLKDPPFTNEKVSNVTGYDPSHISCELYLEKNMHLTTNEDRCDILHSTIYLVKYKGEWKVVNIRGIAE